MKRGILLAEHVLLLTALMMSMSGCRGWKAVPLHNVVPLSQDTFVKDGIEINIAMYSHRSFHITLTNTLENYKLREIPSVLSSTGSLILPAIKGNNQISFNYSPMSAKAVRNEENDITVQWILEETGEEAFLIIRKTVLIDIGRRSASYHVNSVKVVAVSDGE